MPVRQRSEYARRMRRRLGAESTASSMSRSIWSGWRLSRTSRRSTSIACSPRGWVRRSATTCGVAASSLRRFVSSRSPISNTPTERLAAAAAPRIAHQLQHLRSSRRAVAFDFRGHGRVRAGQEWRLFDRRHGRRLAAVVDRWASEGSCWWATAWVAEWRWRTPALTRSGWRDWFCWTRSAMESRSLPAGQAFLAAFESNYDSVIQGYWTAIAGPDSAIQGASARRPRATPREAVVQVLRERDAVRSRSRTWPVSGPMLSMVTPHNDSPSACTGWGRDSPTGW